MAKAHYVHSSEKKLKGQGAAPPPAVITNWDLPIIHLTHYHYNAPSCRLAGATATAYCGHTKWHSFLYAERGDKVVKEIYRECRSRRQNAVTTRRGHVLIGFDVGLCAREPCDILIFLRL